MCHALQSCVGVTTLLCHHEHVVEVMTEAEEVFVEERRPWMSPKYDSNMNSKYNGFLHSATLVNQSHSPTEGVSTAMHCLIVTSNMTAKSYVTLSMR